MSDSALVVTSAFCVLTSYFNLVPFPLDEAGLDVFHGIDDQFDQAAVEDAVFVPQFVVV